MYRVMCVRYAGMIGVEHEVSGHRSKAAAFRKMRSLNYNRQDDDTYYYVADENYKAVDAIYVKKNGRWVVA